MGLVRMAARTAVVAGTATAVSGRVARRQNAKYDAQDQAQYDQQMAQQQAAAPAEPDQNAELQNLANLHTQGVLTDEEFAAAKAKVLGISTGPVACAGTVHATGRGLRRRSSSTPATAPGSIPGRSLAPTSRCREVLDVCCGTGLLAAELIANRVPGRRRRCLAGRCSTRRRRRLGPDVPLDPRDAARPGGEKRFDAVTCTSDGITYLARGDPLRRAALGRDPAPPRRLARLRRAHATR